MRAEATEAGDGHSGQKWMDCMPLFYFDVRDRKGFYKDECGDMCDDLDDAVAQAQSILPDLARDEPTNDDWHDVSCDVRDETMRMVYQAELTYRGRRIAVSPATPVF